jgi:hypothetical protein
MWAIPNFSPKDPTTPIIKPHLDAMGRRKPEQKEVDLENLQTLIDLWAAEPPLSLEDLNRFVNQGCQFLLIDGAHRFWGAFNFVWSLFVYFTSKPTNLANMKPKHAVGDRPWV